MRDAQSITVEQIARTQDTDDPVFKATIGDSYLDFLFPSDRSDDLWIHMVQSRNKGDMKRMLDYVCREYECRRVRFCTPVNDTLAERLTGFTHESEVIDDPDSPYHGSLFESLVGVWEANQ